MSIINIKNKKREITLIIVTAMVIILFFTGYSIGKGFSNSKINTQTQIAEPILVVDNNPSIDITAVKNTGYYDFKIKNYNEEKINQIDLLYNIEIIANTDETISFKIYKDNEEIHMKENKTDNILLTKNEKREHNYRLEIIYDKTKSNSISDIIEDVQIKVHSEQNKI